MTTFDDREKGFEAKYKHDKEFNFKAGARRNKLLGLWAAELLGLEGDAGDAYAREVIESDFEEPGDDDVLRKVHGDLEAKGIDQSAHQVRNKMDQLMEVAREQILSEIKG
ncbi:MAG: DUF1476 domain-containing protein [Alphaproteobacteria bacterium]